MSELQASRHFRSAEPARNFNYERGFGRPAAWRRLKESLGRDYEMITSLLALEKQLGNSKWTPRGLLHYAMHHFIDVDHADRDDMLASFRPMLKATVADTIRDPNRPFNGDFDNDRRYFRPKSWRAIRYALGGTHDKILIDRFEELALENGQCVRVYLAACLMRWVTMPDTLRAAATFRNYAWGEDLQGHDHYAADCRAHAARLMAEYREEGSES